MDTQKNFDLFIEDRCDFCGLCLEKCPELGDDISDPVGTVKRMVAGEYVPEVIERCTNCMICNSVCPQDARPYNLILDHWFERYRRKGIPPVFLGAIPYRDGPNLWTGIRRWYTPEEERDIERWREPGSASEMLFLGCNQQLTPYIAHSSIFDGLTIFSDRRYCCGEVPLRLGILDEARGCALRLKGRLEELGVERLIAFCPACYNTMTNLTPSALDIEYDIDIVPFTEWIKGRMEDGTLEFTRPLDMTVTIQDNCHSSGIGQRFLQDNRDICEAMGLNLREMRGNRDRMRCCGVGAASARYRLIDVLRQGVSRLREARSTGADVVCAYCNGCYFAMNMMRMAYPLAPPVYHLFELIQMATGEEPERRINRRRFEILMAGVESVGKDVLRTKRVHLKS